MTHLWALDLEEDPYVPGRRHPALAHLIVRREPGPSGEVRWSACGRTFTRGTHPAGWWSTEEGTLPLPLPVHCGQGQVTGSGAARSGMSPDPGTIAS
jgi:hypothetical protein